MQAEGGLNLQSLLCYFLSAVLASWWQYTPLVPELRRQSQVDLCTQDQPDVQNKFQGSQSYIEQKNSIPEYWFYRYVLQFKSGFDLHVGPLWMMLRIFSRVYTAIYVYKSQMLRHPFITSALIEAER